jgi:hypothetical protein
MSALSKLSKAAEQRVPTPVPEVITIDDSPTMLRRSTRRRQIQAAPVVVAAPRLPLRAPAVAAFAGPAPVFGPDDERYSDDERAENHFKVHDVVRHMGGRTRGFGYCIVTDILPKTIRIQELNTEYIPSNRTILLANLPSYLSGISHDVKPSSLKLVRKVGREAQAEIPALLHPPMLDTGFQPPEPERISYDRLG